MRSLVETEMLVLRALCQVTPRGSVGAEAAWALSTYQWHEPIHQPMFSCLARIAAAEPDELRRILIECLTRKGFPDVDLDIFFRPPSVTHQEATHLIQQLLKS
jgi:hypothetical protein